MATPEKRNGGRPKALRDKEERWIELYYLRAKTNGTPIKVVVRCSARRFRCAEITVKRVIRRRVLIPKDTKNLVKHIEKPVTL